MFRTTRRLLSEVRRCLLLMLLAWSALFAVASLVPSAPRPDLSARSDSRESGSVALEDGTELRAPAD
jgi:hypothetical protein